MEFRIWDIFIYDYHWYDNHIKEEWTTTEVVQKIVKYNWKITKINWYQIEWCQYISEEEEKKDFRYLT